MKQRYTVFRRENGIYYSLDTVTKKRNSLNTADREEAKRFLNAINEACKQPAINLQIAQVYLQHSDPDFAKRTWQHVMDEMGRNKSGSLKLLKTTSAIQTKPQKRPSPHLNRNVMKRRDCWSKKPL